MAYQCSLIINVYNQAEELALVLESVARQSVPDFEVIIADDGSGDNTPDVIQKFRQTHPNIPLAHFWHEDTGFNKSSISNKAVRESSSDYLIFVDGDMILHPRFVEAHLCFRGPGKVLVGSRGVKLREDFVKRLKDGKEQVNLGFFGLIKKRLRGDLSYWSRGLVIKNRILRKLLIKPVHRLTGCNFSMYKTTWETVNGMDNTIGVGCEDFEFGCRLQKAGYDFVTISKCANTFHMEHSQHAISKYGKQIRATFRQNPYTKCKHGYAELEEGSTAESFWTK